MDDGNQKLRGSYSALLQRMLLSRWSSTHKSSSHPTNLMGDLDELEVKAGLFISSECSLLVEWKSVMKE